MAKINRSILPVNPHLLMIGLGISVTLALAVTVIPLSGSNVQYQAQEVDSSYAAEETYEFEELEPTAIPDGEAPAMGEYDPTLMIDTSEY